MLFCINQFNLLQNHYAIDQTYVLYLHSELQSLRATSITKGVECRQELLSSWHSRDHYKGLYSQSHPLQPRRDMWRAIRTLREFLFGQYLKFKIWGIGTFLVTFFITFFSGQYLSSKIVSYYKYFCSYFKLKQLTHKAFRKLSCVQIFDFLHQFLSYA